MIDAGGRTMCFERAACALYDLSFTCPPTPCVDWCSDMFSPFWFTAVNAPGEPCTFERHRRMCSGHRNRGCCTRPSIIGCFDPTRLQLHRFVDTADGGAAATDLDPTIATTFALRRRTIHIIGGKHTPFRLALPSSSVAVLCCGESRTLQGDEGSPRRRSARRR